MKHDTLKSISKSLDILKLFIDNKPELSIAEISKLSGLNKPTSFRIVNTLVQHGFLLQKERRGSYSLGLIYINFYKTINNQLYFRNTFMPYLADLSEKVNEQIVIAYANGLNDPFAEVFTDNTLVKKHMLNVTPDSSGKVPLHVSSLGKIILADLNEEEIKGYFENKEFKKTTPNTITDYQVMREHLTRIRQDCIAFDDEEYQSGIRSLAAGIRDGNGKIIAAIGVIAPSVRMTYLKMQELTSVVRDCAMEISRALGFKS